MFSSYLFVLLSTFILLAGIGYFLWYLFIRPVDPNNNIPGSDDEGDDEGGLEWDMDAPLDLPPGIYILPSEPVRAA